MHAADEVPDDEDPESFYGEDIFDDIIAKAMEAESKMESAPTNTNSERIAVKGTPGDLENRQSNRGTGNDYSYGSAPEHDAASLDSGEISGESDISAMDAEHGENGKTNPYNPSPLVNDDESTIDMRPPAPNNQTVSSYVDQLNRSERSKGRLIKAGSFAICIAIVVGVVLAVISLTGNKDGATGNVGRISDNAQVSTGGRLPGAEKEKSLAPAASSMAAFAIIPVPVTASFPVTAPPTRPPTERPAMASSTETIHPVQLTFENIPSGYKLLEKDRTPIVDFIEELLSDHMDESFELLEVAYARANAGERSRRSLQRQVESFSIPLRIVVRGPSNFSQDFKQSYVMEKIQERSNDIVNYLKAYNWKTFNNVRISEVVEFDIADLVDPTVSPMMSPVQSVQPIRSPSQTPSGKTVGVTQPPILTRTAPPVTNEPTQKPTQYTIAAIVTTSSPVTNVPTRRPTRRPTRYPTGRPTKGRHPHQHQTRLQCRRQCKLQGRRAIQHAIQHAGRRSGQRGGQHGDQWHHHQQSLHHMVQLPVIPQVVIQHSILVVQQ